MIHSAIYRQPMREMATPTNSFGFIVTEDRPGAGYPMDNHEKKVGVLKSNEKFVNALKLSFHCICKELLDFHASIKISGSLLFNIDSSIFDVVEINENVAKITGIKRGTSSKGQCNPSETEDTLSASESTFDRSHVPLELLPFAQPHTDMIDVEVQTDLSHGHLYLSSNITCPFLSEKTAADNETDKVYPTQIVHRDKTGSLTAEIIPKQRCETVTGLQKITGATKKNYSELKHVKVQKKAGRKDSIVTSEISTVNSQETSEDALGEQSSASTVTKKAKVEEAVCDTGEDVSCDSEPDQDKDDPDFCPDGNLSGKKDSAKNRRSSVRKEVINNSAPCVAGRVKRQKKSVKITGQDSKVTNMKGTCGANMKEKRGKKVKLKYPCQDCSVVFTAASKLRAHQRKAHDKGALKCKECGKMYSCSVTLRRHMSSVHHGDKYTCDICGRSFTSPNTLYHHKRGEHSDKKPFSCEQCQKPFKFYHSYKLHMLQHTGVRPHKCLQCDKTYLTSNHLKQHVQVVHGLSRNYSCDTCGKRFGYLNSLKVHQKLHSNERPYTCTICSKGFINLGALKAHAGRHVEGRNFKCDECGKYYKTEFLLKIHKRRHTSAVSRFMCDVCGLTFMFKSNLEMHAAVHSDVKKFQCSTCGKAFKTYPTLYSHQQCHNPNDPFRCSVCGKMFKTKGRCYAHEKRHTEQKKHPCNFCEKMFSSKGDLSKHKRTVHGDTKRFSCPICFKPSARSDNLRVHLTRVHGRDPKQVNLEILQMANKGDQPQNDSNERQSSSGINIQPVEHATLSQIGITEPNPANLDQTHLSTLAPLHSNIVQSTVPHLPQQIDSVSYSHYMSLHHGGMSGYWYQGDS